MPETRVPLAISVNDFRALAARTTSCAILLALTIILTACAGTSGNNGGGGGTPPPTATMTAAPAAIFPGQPVVLTFSSTNANQGSIDMGEGPVGFNGGVTVNPTVTTTYTFTATGPGGSATAKATVTVNQVTAFDAMQQSDGVTDQDVDPNGAIGTKQYLEYINTAIQAYDKTTGNPVWSSPKPIESLWPTGPCAVSSTTGKPVIQLDVVVVFDRLAAPNGRWVVGAKTTNPNHTVGYYFCLAVSSTDDLSSGSLTWNSYSSAKLDPVLTGNGTHTYFPDWPKISTWTDASGQQSAYYATMDLQDIDNGNNEVGAVVCAFDRTGILTTPSTIKREACTNVSHLNDAVLWSNSTFMGHSLIPADIDGSTVPPTGRDEFMVSIENPVNDNVTLISSALNLWEFHVDWTASPPTLTATHSPITVPDYIPGCYLTVPANPAITNCVQEPASATGQPPEIVDSVGDRLMPRFAYRNFGSFESYLVTHAVQTGNNSQNAQQTGVRWYEFRDSGSGTPALNQSGTLNPDDVLYRFLPSIAQDKAGNVVVGYSTANRFTNPGIYFSYWNLSNATAPAEILIFQGDGEEVTNVAPFAGKWGTYSSMTVDPVNDCTFWYVNEYFMLDTTWRTRIANLKVPGCK